MSQSDDIRALLSTVGYIADDQLATALGIATQIDRPLLLEGQAGVGKTFVASAYAKAAQRKLIRLQCYEGLDATQALYEWNYQAQILAIANAREMSERMDETALFSEKYLLKRPLLDAISQDTPPVLLIDEIDRADEEFEAFLLETLDSYQVTIPELGTIEASSKPLTILTSNGTRELSDALRRRCLFHYVKFPDLDAELRIVKARAPECSVKLAHQIVSYVQALRKESLKKTPGVAETLDWTAALVGLDISDLRDDPELVHRTLLCVLKTAEDQEVVPLAVSERLAEQST